MLKKVIAVIVVLSLLACLSGCKDKKPASGNKTDTSKNENISSVDSSVTSTESTTSDSTESTQSPTESTVSVVSKPQTNTPSNTTSSKPSNGNNQQGQGKATATLIADMSRSPSTDVSSFIDSGYIYYYDPEVKDYSVVLRKKLDGSGEPEVVFDFPIGGFTVLNGTIYYTKDGNIYSCTAESHEPKLIYKNANVYGITVAGEWIISSTKDTDGGSAFCFISLDGKQRHVVRPKMKYEDSKDFTCELKRYGYNRGYFYYNISYTKTIYTSEKGSIKVRAERDSLQERFDYRSKEFKTATLLDNASFKYNGSNWGRYDLDFNQGYFVTCDIGYDYIIQGAVDNKYFSVSLSQHKGQDIFTAESGLSRPVRVKEYIATCENYGYGPEYVVRFIDMQGNVTRVNIPNNTEYTVSTIDLYGAQSIHTNGVLLERDLRENDGVQLLYVTPDGKITEIYTVFDN